jgi:hypothetical protein
LQVKVTSDLRVIAPPDAPPLTGAQAMTLGKRLLEKGVIKLARETAVAYPRRSATHAAEGSDGNVV